MATLLREDLSATLQQRLEEAAQRKATSESILAEASDCSFLIGQNQALQHLNSMSGHIAAARRDLSPRSVGLTGRYIGDDAYHISVDPRPLHDALVPAEQLPLPAERSSGSGGSDDGDEPDGRRSGRDGPGGKGSAGRASTLWQKDLSGPDVRTPSFMRNTLAAEIRRKTHSKLLQAKGRPSSFPWWKQAPLGSAGPGLPPAPISDAVSPPPLPPVQSGHVSSIPPY
jgi:hypothetical protein